MIVLPDLCRWIADNTPALNALIARRAMCDVGILELTSNRSGVIDGYMDAVGSPRGEPWCAAAASAWFREMGADTPPQDAGSTKAWKAWGFSTNRWSSTAGIGRAVIYGGSDGIPEHMGVIVRVTPTLLSVEANTSLQGYSTNGVACAMKGVTISRVLGYINPTPLTGNQQ